MFKAQNQRLKYVDSAKGIGILMIAWGHLDKMKSPVFVLFSASKLAVFFILSGLMFAHRWQVYGKKEDCRSLIQKKIIFLADPISGILIICDTISYSICGGFLYRGKKYYYG